MVKIVTVLEKQACKECKGTGKCCGGKRCRVCNGSGETEVEVLR